MILLPKGFKKRYEKIDPPLKLIEVPFVAYLFDLSYENTENRRFVNWPSQEFKRNQWQLGQPSGQAGALGGQECPQQVHAILCQRSSPLAVFSRVLLCDIAVVPAGSPGQDQEVPVQKTSCSRWAVA